MRGIEAQIHSYLWGQCPSTSLNYTLTGDPPGLFMLFWPLQTQYLRKEPLVVPPAAPAQRGPWKEPIKLIKIFWQPALNYL